jgi:branched-subunit amino acid aminotransferase/4-amino-4-deoxychorismate lyase
MSVQYICHNGEFIPEAERIISHRNRAFLYGDALFETIHCLGTSPQFLANHWVRLSQGIKLLKMNPGPDFTQENIVYYIEKLLNKNRIFKGARVRLVVFRNEGGLYAPEQDTLSWIMESAPLETEKFELNTKGYVIDLFDGLHKPVNSMSNLKTNNALPFVLAGIFRRDNNLDDCLILNQFGRIIEAVSSNVFLVFSDRLVTPPLSEGCIAGTMRHTMLSIARLSAFRVEERGILEKQLIDADEIFLTNAIQGIRWVGAYKDKRYFNFVARKLLARLNEAAFGG